MLGVFRRIKDRKLSSSADSAPVKAPVLEKLEPRILLSADSLLIAAVPDPLEDNTQQVVMSSRQMADICKACEARLTQYA